MFESFLILLFLITSCAVISKNEVLQINQRLETYELDVPISKLVMIIPKDGFVQKDNRQGRGTDNPRYFYFVNERQKIIISGWFEPEQKYSGIETILENDMKASAAANLPLPKNVSFITVSNWDAVIFDQPYDGFTIAHLRAHWLQAGTWIDIHISQKSNSSNSEARSRLIEILKAIQVREKNSVKS